MDVASSGGMRIRTALLGALLSLLLVSLPTASEAVTFNCGTAAQQTGAGTGGTGAVALTNFSCGNNFTFTGRVDALDSPTLAQLVLTGTIAYSGAVAAPLTVAFASSFGDFAARPFDTYVFNLAALGSFTDAFGGTNATGDSFAITGNAANSTLTGPLAFAGTPSAYIFDSSSTVSGSCGFGGIEGSQCFPSLSVNSTWTFSAGHSVDLPVSLTQRSQAVPEPTTVLLLLPGIAGLVLSCRTRLYTRGT
jgi:hypothetical protein